MKMIICTVTNDLNFDQRMIRICTSLSNAGYDVRLVGRQLKHSPPIVEQPFRQKRFRLYFNKGKLFYLEYNIRLFLFLLIEKFDIVCTVDLDTLLPGFLSASIKNKDIVFDAHEYFSEVPEVVERPLVKKIWEQLAQFVLPRIKYAYTVCDSLSVIFEEKYRTPFQVIRNLPSAKQPCNDQMPRQDETTILLYQGVLNVGRGLEETICAMESMEGVELWLAGEGDLSQKLREMVEEKGLQSKIIFHGKVNPADLPHLTCKADIGLNLLKNKSLNYYYSLANKTFDYMQAGIPSLCMAFPEYKKINEEFDALILLEELTPKAILLEVDRLKKNKNYYSEKCKNSKKASEQLVWEKEELKLLSIYESILQHK